MPKDSPVSVDNNKDMYLSDPLSEVTRKERRMLLAVSMIGVTLVEMELVPTKISALGIEFAKTNQESLLNILALIVIYFVAAFLIYASADFLAWRKLIRRKTIDSVMDHVEKENSNPQLYQEQSERLKHIPHANQYMFFFTKPVSILRALFEFILPVAVGLYSTYILLNNNITGT